MSFFSLKSISEANQSGYKSTIMRPIYGLSAFCMSATILSYIFKLPIWITNTSFIFVILLVVIAISTYVFFVFKNPDYLRSEWHSISKLAIEAKLMGDDKHKLENNNLNISTPTERLIDKPEKLGGEDA